jgi:eukaryotic-like serine/threonine-protein kinase
MTPEHWERVREVLHQALELAPEQRPAFLDQACSSDHSLRQEVESFMASAEKAGSELLESSAMRVRLPKGTRLGDYEVQSLLGSGGMGEVYRARDRRLDREVAIKVLPSDLSSAADRLRRFEQEAKAAAALNHPNILAVFQMGSYEGAPYLVSELLEGLTLREQLGRGALPIRKALDYAIQIAHGLAAAHDKGIVHRDLKPENLFVTKDGRIKILDFGLAKLTERKAESKRTTPIGDQQTEPGMVMGTVGYMSPEQVRGEPADHRADIFAFGAILYEMLSGKRAFHGTSAVETMGAILKDDPSGFSQIIPAIPTGLQRIVYRCLEKGREPRFQSASDLGFALESLSDVGIARPTATAVTSRRALSRRRIGWTLGSLTALVFLGLIVSNINSFRKTLFGSRPNDGCSDHRSRQSRPATRHFANLHHALQGCKDTASSDRPGAGR